MYTLTRLIRIFKIFSINMKKIHYSERVKPEFRKEEK